MCEPWHAPKPRWLGELPIENRFPRVAQVACNLGLLAASWFRFRTCPTLSVGGLMSDHRRVVCDQAYVHFITFSVYRRRRLLDLDHPKRIVLGVLNHTLDASGGKCSGFVIMPNHAHALIWLPVNFTLVRFLHGWKRMSSFRIRQWYTEHAPHYFQEFGAGDQFWQPKYYSFEIHAEKKLQEKLDYVHLNPVRAGLVQRAVDWQWSSARWYYENRSVGVKIEPLAG